MSERASIRTVLGRWAMAAVVVAALGLLAGLTTARSNPRLAAGALVADFVIVEEPVVAAAAAGAAGTAADATAVAPSSGTHAGDVRCGVHEEPVSNDDQLATLAAGGIVVRFRDAGLAAEVAAWARGRDWVLAAPEPALDVPVVALAWGRRMELPEVRIELLSAFATAEVGLAEPPTQCRGTSPSG